MLKMAQQSLRTRLQGCLVGAVAGDCLGAPYEVTGVPATNVFEELNKFSSEIETQKDTCILQYTDDTAMARCIAQSLIDTRGEFSSKDLAKKFAEEFVAFPKRGYGANVITILRDLGKDQDDVFELARSQFGGSGSYGNGGAMRVAPVGLCPERDFDRMIEVARQSALLTHSNAMGYNGAILQCCAVHLALHSDPATFDLDKFMDKLIGIMEKETVGTGEGGEKSENATRPEKRARKAEADGSMSNEYVRRLSLIKPLLAEDASTKRVASELGNYVSAHKSVPAAIYSFLRCMKPVEGIETTSALERTILFAIALDGDTDTIASMAGAIAGAFYGVEAVPAHWMTVCEGADHALQQANSLYDIKFGQQSQ